MKKIKVKAEKKRLNLFLIIVLGIIILVAVVLISIKLGKETTGKVVSEEESKDNLELSQITLAEEIKYMPREILIKFKSDPGIKKVKKLGKIQITTNKPSINSLNIKYKIIEAERFLKFDDKKLDKAKEKLKNVYKLKTESEGDLLKIIEEYKQDPNVEYAEPNYIYNISLIPNDLDYSKQYGLHQIIAEKAWDIEQGDENVVIAIIDTGVDYTHPDLQDNIWHNPDEIADNGIDDDGNGFVDDYYGWDFVGLNYQNPVEDNDPIDDYGHGTHVAGIAAAKGNNGAITFHDYYYGDTYNVGPAPGTNTLDLAWDGESLWSTDSTRKIYKFSDHYAKYQLIQEFDSPLQQPYGITWDGSSLWVTDRSTLTLNKLQITYTDSIQTDKVRIYITKINTLSELRINEFEIYDTENNNIALQSQGAIAYTLGGYNPRYINDGDTSSFWLVLFSPPTWAYIDFGEIKNVAKVTIKTTIGRAPIDYEIQTWDGSNWVTKIQKTGSSPNAEQLEHDLVPSSLNVTEQITMPLTDPTALTWGRNYFWLVNSADDKIYQLDRSGQIVHSINAPGNNPAGLAFDSFNLWNIDSVTKKIYRIDSQTGEIKNEYNAYGTNPTGLIAYFWNRHILKSYQICNQTNQTENNQTNQTNQTCITIPTNWEDTFFLYNINSYNNNVIHSLFRDTYKETGVAGLCWNCKIMSIKFLDPTGYGTTTEAAKAIQYAIDNGAYILSNSWGSGGYSQVLQDLVNIVYDNNKIFIAAAGNSDSDNLHYPATYENSISVAAVSTSSLYPDKRADFSNFGEWVDVSAPGTNIYSTLPSYESFTMHSRYNYDMYYDYLSGTSMATPFVAGLAGLIKSKNPEWNNEMVIGQLVNTADDISSDNIEFYKNKLGTGRINAYKALTETPKKVIKYDGYQLDRSQGDDNIKFVVKLKADWIDVDNVRAFLTTPDDHIIDIIDGESDYDNIEWLKDNSNNPFIISIKNNMPANFLARFKLKIIANGYDNTINFEVPFVSEELTYEGLGYYDIGKFPLYIADISVNNNSIFATTLDHVAWPYYINPATGIYRKNLSGGAWERLSSANGLPSSYFATDISINENLAFAVISDTNKTYLYKSANNGNNWVLINVPISTDYEPISVELSPFNEQKVYALYRNSVSTTSGGKLCISADSGLNWNCKSTSVISKFSTNFNLDYLYIYPEQENYLLIISGQTNINEDGKLYKSIDDGTSGEYITTPGALNSIAISFSNPDVIYAGVGNPYITYSSYGVYKSSNGGLTWENVNEIFPASDKRDYSWHIINRIMLDPLNDKHLYINVFGRGVYESVDGGKSWVRLSDYNFSNGVYNVYSRSIELKSGRLYIGSSWDGLFSMNAESYSPICGNNLLEPGEDCDRNEDKNCRGLCLPNCFCPEPICGNDIREMDEECDGSDDSACPGNCHLETCTCCGNNVINLISPGISTNKVRLLISETFTGSSNPRINEFEIFDDNGNNIALNKPVSVSGGFWPERINDGNDGSGSYWQAWGEKPWWVEIDLGSERKVEKAVIKAYINWGVPKDFEIQTWDGNNWITQQEVVGNTLNIFESKTLGIYEECDGSDDSACPGNCNVNCICSEPQPDCTDTDRGINYNLKGKVELRTGEIYEDSCAGSFYIQEYYCENNEKKITTMACPKLGRDFKCIDGACVSSIPPTPTPIGV